MVLNRINLLVAGGNEGGERGRQVPLEEEGESGAGTATTALPCLRGCTFPWLGLIFPVFQSFLKLETERPPLSWTARRNSRLVFNIQIIKFPPINSLLLIILKGLTIRRQYSAIDFHSRRMTASPLIHAGTRFGGFPPSSAALQQRDAPAIPFSPSAGCSSIGTRYTSLWLMANCLDYFYCCTHYVN